MLTKRAKAYSSFCSQIVLVYLRSFRHNSLMKCALQPKIAKINKKTLVLKVQGLSKSSMSLRLKSSKSVLVVICIMPMPICNRFHERLANSGKIMIFTGVRSLMLSCAGFLEPRKSKLGPSKSTFNAENSVCRLSWCISTVFGAICS